MTRLSTIALSFSTTNSYSCSYRVTRIIAIAKPTLMILLFPDMYIIIGMITLVSSSIEVQEDDGNVMVCLETDDAICLIVHSQEKEAGIVAIIRESVDSI